MITWGTYDVDKDVHEIETHGMDTLEMETHEGGRGDILNGDGDTWDAGKCQGAYLITVKVILAILINLQYNINFLSYFAHFIYEFTSDLFFPILSKSSPYGLANFIMVHEIKTSKVQAYEK